MTEYSDGDLKYTLNDNFTAIVNGLSDGNNKNKIEIPAQIEYGDKNYTVTTIEASAFFYTLIDYIIIPKTVKTIEAIAFGYSKLSKITFAGDSELTTIRNNAFRNTLIENIIIPKSVTTIGISAFYGSKLREITIPDDSELTSIEDNAFFNTLIDNIIIPKNVITIGNSAFNRCKKLKNVYFKGDKPEIGKYAFYDSGNLFNRPIGHFEPNNNSWNGTKKIDFLYFNKSLSILNSSLVVIFYILCPLLIYGTTKLKISNIIKIPMYIFSPLISIALIILLDTGVLI